MTQSRTEGPSEFAHEAGTPGEWERDREAWNLPRAVAVKASARGDRDGLDWDGFSATYFPGGGRHNLEAIVAYGVYKKSGIVDERQASQAERTTATGSIPSGVRSVDAWEDEGGTPR